MKQFIMLLSLAALFSCVSPLGVFAEPDDIAVPYEAKFQEIFPQGDNAKFEELLAEVSEAIKKNDTNIRLRMLRIGLNTLLNRQRDMAEDFNRMVELEPHSPSRLWNKCIYDEQMNGGESVEIIQCYRRVVDLYEQGDFPLRDKDMFYTLAALMGEHPRAEQIKRRYLDTLGDSPLDERNRRIITQFYRKMFFETNPKVDIF